MDCIDLTDISVDFRGERVVARDGTRLELRPCAFAVLRCLAARAGELVTKDDLLSACWPNVAVTEDSLTQCICEIRRVLGRSGRDLIRTVPRRGYMLVPPEAGPAALPAVRHSFWQPIAVLPFDEFGEAPPGFAGMGAGFAEDLTTELARNRQITVVARQSAFASRAAARGSAEIARTLGVRYVLEGSVRHAGASLIVNAQLIDGRDSRHIWAERIAVPRDAFFAMQDELTGRIATSLFAGLCEAEQIARLACAGAPSSAYDLTVEAMAHLNQFSPRDLLLAHTALDRALALDPALSTAHALKGLVVATDAALAISGPCAPQALPLAEAAIRRALDLNPASPLGHRALSYLLVLHGRYEEGLAAAERGLALAPHDAGALAFLAMAQTASGRYGPALAHAESALARSPVPTATYSGAAAAACYALGRFEEARHFATVATQRSPGYTIAYAVGAAADDACGHAAQGRARIAALRGHGAHFGLGAPRVRTIYGSDPALGRRFVAALERAGLPERPEPAAGRLPDGI